MSVVGEGASSGEGLLVREGFRVRLGHLHGSAQSHVARLGEAGREGNKQCKRLRVVKRSAHLASAAW